MTLINTLNKADPLGDFKHFWALQLIFWAGLCVITFLTLTVWYGQIGWRHLSHTALQGLMGIVFSFPLHVVFSIIWNSEQKLRVLISFLAVAFVAGLWNVFRMILFIWLTKEDGIWEDFGGWYFGALFVFLCWTALYHGIRYYQLLQSESVMKAHAEASVSEEKFKRLNAESEAKDAQLKMLRYQLNPHFLFNTLNAINSLIGTEEPERAQTMVVQLSQFLRYSLDNNPEMKIPLDREIEALMLYLEIEKTRFGDRLELDFKIDENAKTALVPSLILQPLIENSMKYAIAKSENGGEISLRAHVYERVLVLTLSDSGSGAKTQSSKIKSASGRGIGLRNTVDRLKAFYAEQYTFDLVGNAKGGLKTVIEIPHETLVKGSRENMA
ncbi:MAG: two-component system LytT family sensor kinase [Cryomorphaceae bacterium]|jgi:two-component system LytT family sensor kinase